MTHFRVADLTFSLKTKWAAQPCICLRKKTLTFKIMITVIQRERVASYRRKGDHPSSNNARHFSIVSIRKKIGEGTNTRMGAWKERRRMSFPWCNANSLKPSHQSQSRQVQKRLRTSQANHNHRVISSPSSKKYANKLLKSNLKKKKIESVTFAIVCRTSPINETILHVYHQPNRGVGSSFSVCELEKKYLILLTCKLTCFKTSSISAKDKSPFHGVSSLFYKKTIFEAG